MTRREGTYVCAQCGSKHTSVMRHEDGSAVTMDDRPELARKILDGYAAVRGHAALLQLRELILPPPNGDGRTREHKAWTEQWLEMTFISCIDLVDAGLLKVVEEPCGSDDEPMGTFPWGLAITDAGRRWLETA